MLEGDALAAWLSARCGKLTASRMRAAMSFKRDGTPSAERSQLMRELLAERVTGDSVRHYVTDAMQWGLEREDEAKAAYEAVTGGFVTPCGFYDHPSIDMFGGTPDGLRNSSGLVEVKCPTTATFLDWSLAGVVPEEHKPQMTAQLACTGRLWCDFVAFDPRVRRADKRLFVVRFTPTRKDIEAVESAAVQFLAELEKMFDTFTERTK